MTSLLCQETLSAVNLLPSNRISASLRLRLQATLPHGADVFTDGQIRSLRMLKPAAKRLLLTICLQQGFAQAYNGLSEIYNRTRMVTRKNVPAARETPVITTQELLEALEV